MAKAVGLDIGTRSVKVAELEGSGKKVRVSRIFVRDVPAREDGGIDEAAIADTIRAIFKEGRLPRETVAASLPTRDTILREILVPFKTDDQIRKVVKFEAEGHIEQCSLDELVVEHVKVGEVEGKSRVIVLAARKDALGRLLSISEKAGVDPIVVDIDALSLFTAVTLSPAVEKYGAFAAVDLGSTSTNIIVVVKGALRVVRSLRMGDDSLANAISRDLEIPRLEAEKRKVLLLAGPGAASDLVAPLGLAPESDEDRDRDEKPEIEKSHHELESDLIAQKRNEFVEKVSRELARTLAGAKFEAPLDAVLLTGGGSALPGLADALRARLSIDVLPFNPLDVVPNSAPQAERSSLGLRSSTAIGLAAKLLGHEPIKTDFRQEEYRYQKRFDQVKVVLACCVSLMVILFSITCFHFWRKQRVYAGTYDGIVRWAKAKYDQADPGARPISVPRFAQIGTMTNRLAAENKDLLKKVGSGGDFPPIRSVLQTYVELFRALQASGKQLEGLIVRQIEVRQTTERVTLTLKGSAPTTQMIDDLRKAVQKAYPDVSPGPVTSDTDSSRYAFDGFVIQIPNAPAAKK